MHRELGCQQRAQEVVKVGAADLTNDLLAEDDEAVLARFIAYICRIEKEVDARKQRGRDLDKRQKTSRGAAQERAHSHHDKSTKPYLKGAPPIRAYKQPATDLANRQRTSRGDAQERAHSLHDEGTKPKSKGAPPIRADGSN